MINKIIKNCKLLFNKDRFLYLLTLIAIIGYGIYQIGLPITDIQAKTKMIEDLNSQITSLEAQAQQAEMQLQMEKNKSETSSDSSSAKIYVSPDATLDVESAGFNLVDKLIPLFKQTGNKITEISFTSSPYEGNTGSLNLILNTTGSYISLKALLNKIYTWDYLVGIKSLNITPNIKNPNMLYTKMVLTLYINKS